MGSRVDNRHVDLKNRQVGDFRALGQFGSKRRRIFPRKGPQAPSAARQHRRAGVKRINTRVARRADPISIDYCSYLHVLGAEPCSFEERGQAIELFAGLVVDDDLAAIRVSGPDQDGGSEIAMESLLEIEKMGGLERQLVRGVFSDPGARRGRHAGGDQGLGLADGEVLIDDSPAGGRLAFGVGKAQKCASVALGDFVFADGVQDVGGQVEQADQVGNGRSIDAQPAGQLFLGAAVAREVFAEGRRLVDGVQVFALKVFDHCQLEDALIVEHHDSRGHFVKLGFDARTQPALAGDQLVSRSLRSRPARAGAYRAGGVSRPARRSRYALNWRRGWNGLGSI